MVPLEIRAAQALSSEVSLDKLSHRLMTIIAENAGAERGALILKRESGAAIVAELSLLGEVHVAASPVPVDESADLSKEIVSHVFRTRESVILTDATTEGPFTADPYIVRRRPKAVLCMPLLQTGEVAGAIYLENNLVPDAFTARRAELLRVLCAQMAISIDNARLHADLEQKVGERTRALQEAQARLEQLEKDATELQVAGGFAHEMRNALVAAKLMLFKIYRETPGADAWSASVDNSKRLLELFATIQEHIPGPVLPSVVTTMQEINATEQGIDAALQQIKRSIERGLGITYLILDYAQIGRVNRGAGLVSVTDLVTTIVQELADDFATHCISVDVDVAPGCSLRGDEVHFHSILKNLVSNARDALLEVRENGVRALSIRAVEDAARVVISVQDTGVGMPLDQHDKIFEPFFSTKPTTGTGLGLGMVRKFTSLYGGTIEFDSVPQRGTTFRVILPKERRGAAIL
jgi:histidine kinase